MSYQFQSLAAGPWRSLSLVEQLANIGSEVERALELIDLTIADPRHRGRLKEITRLREVLLDYFMGENLYQSNEDFWRKYFYAFGYAARSSIK